MMKAAAMMSAAPTTVSVGKISINYYINVVFSFA
jgi:uncharacterized protein YggE